VSTLSVTQISRSSSHILTFVIIITGVIHVAVADHLQGRALDTATYLRSVSSKITTKISTSHIPTHFIAHHSVIAKLCVADALAINPVFCNCAISSLASTVYVANGVRYVHTNDP
jgi:hypothetical protein